MSWERVRRGASGPGSPGRGAAATAHARGPCRLLPVRSPNPESWRDRARAELVGQQRELVDLLHGPQPHPVAEDPARQPRGTGTERRRASRIASTPATIATAAITISPVVEPPVAGSAQLSKVSTSCLHRRPPDPVGPHRRRLGARTLCPSRQTARSSWLGIRCGRRGTRTPDSCLVRAVHRPHLGVVQANMLGFSVRRV